MQYPEEKKMANVEAMVSKIYPPKEDTALKELPKEEFKVWVQIEEYQEETDTYTEHDPGFGATAVFDNMEQANEHAQFVHDCGRDDVWTIVLMYPGGTGDRGLYITVIQHPSMEDAEKAACIEASDANNGNILPDEFKMIVAFQGDHHHQWSANDI